LAEYRKLEQQLAGQMLELESLRGDSRLQKEIEFETKLLALLGEYGHSLRDIVGILDPNAGASDKELSSTAGAGKRKR